MNMEDQVRETIIAELGRQAEEGQLQLHEAEDGAFTVNGRVDLDALSMAVVGHLAGGP